MSIRNVLLCGLIAMGPVAMPTLAQININIDIGVAPPAPRYEVVPAPRSGYSWAPGYWQWEGQRHVWAAGRWIEARPDSYWVADRWEPKNGRHHFKPGRWEHDSKREERDHEGRGKGKGKGHDKR